MKINKIFLLISMAPVSLMASESEHIINSTYTIPNTITAEKSISQNNFESFTVTIKMNQDSYEKNNKFIQKIDFNKVSVKKPINFTLFPLFNDQNNLNNPHGYNITLFTISF